MSGITGESTESSENESKIRGDIIRSKTTNTRDRRPETETVDMRMSARHRDKSRTKERAPRAPAHALKERLAMPKNINWWSGTTNGACCEDTEECPVVITTARYPRTEGMACRADGYSPRLGSFKSAMHSRESVLTRYSWTRWGWNAGLLPALQALLREDGEVWNKPTSEGTGRKQNPRKASGSEMADLVKGPFRWLRSPSL
ncbi:hypothetical protein H4582DRAFT_2057999 [Lactarius indigo]|nr:hypothetical protein H4582DRAFT_2057999 [Lactarius indigo]